ncbi:MAG: hypothetical protein HC905_32445, partial [Bacteroidales bacterium]|nr:hypothetical protein [Bacteroidales bacterium]
LLIMDKDVTPVQADKTLTIVGRAHLDASGARPSGDRIKIAGILAKNALFSRNKEVFEKQSKLLKAKSSFRLNVGCSTITAFITAKIG